MLVTSVEIAAPDELSARIDGAKELGVQPDEVKLTPLADGLYTVALVSIPGDFDIQVDPDKMFVTLSSITPPPADGAPVTAEKILKELKQQKIVFGINEELIGQVAERVAHTRTPEENIRIAEGQTPVHGTNAHLELQIGPDALNKDPAASFMVKAGQILGVKVPADNGTAGRNVFGEELPAKPGGDHTVKAGENVSIAKDGLTFSAAVYGKAVITESSISVEDLVAISEDKMSATLPVYPILADNSRLAIDDIRQTLKKHGIVHGIREEEINRVLAGETAQPQMEAALGTPAQDGVDAKVEFKFTLHKRNPETVDQARADGVIPEKVVLKELMQSGDILAVKIPAQPPVPGSTILGDALPGTEAVDKEINAGENVTLLEDGRTFAVSEEIYAGYADFRAGVLNVEDPVRITEDSLKVYLTAHPPAPDGKSLTPEIVMEILSRRGVVHGISEKNIRKALELTRDKGRPLHDALIARGSDPVRGQDARIDFLVDFDSQAGATSDEDGIIDFRERGLIHTIRQGEALAHKYPALEGIEGHDVFGNPIAAEAGTDTNLIPLSGVVVSEDGFTYTAEIEGMISLIDGNKIGVFQQYEVKGDVDYSVGNLDMEGTLVIKGWVRPGFTVKASGDILIGGGVEDGVVEAGTNVVIGGGVIGSGHCKIIAKGDVSASFLEEAHVRAGGDIEIKNEIMRSKLIAGGSLRAISGKGRIRGGNISAMKGVEANEIGSVANVKTVVMVGIDLACQRRIREVTKQLKEYQRNRAKMDTVLAKYIGKSKQAGGKMDRDLARKLAMLSKKRRNSVLAETRLAKARTEACQRLAAIELQNTKVVVKKKVYTGTAVVIGKTVLRVQEDIMHPITFKLNENGQIEAAK